MTHSTYPKTLTPASKPLRVCENASLSLEIGDPLALFEAAKARYAGKSAAKRKAHPPRGNGPAHAYRACDALPPPHIRFPAGTTRASERERAQKRALMRGHRELAGAPDWARFVAKRCHEGDWRAEVRMLAGHSQKLALRVQKACEPGRSEAARRSRAAIACVIAWCAIRHPQRVRHRKVANVGGISGGALRVLTRRSDGDPYSLSWLQHAQHGKGEGAGLDTEGMCGALEALAQAGAIIRWVPPVGCVPPYMVGPSGYAFLAFALHIDCRPVRGP